MDYETITTFVREFPAMFSAVAAGITGLVTGSYLSRQKTERIIRDSEVTLARETTTQKQLDLAQAQEANIELRHRQDLETMAIQRQQELEDDKTEYDRKQQQTAVEKINSNLTRETLKPIIQDYAQALRTYKDGMIEARVKLNDLRQEERAKLYDNWRQKQAKDELEFDSNDIPDFERLVYSKFPDLPKDLVPEPEIPQELREFLEM